MLSQAWANAAMGNAMPSLGVSSLLSSSIYQLLGGSGSFSESMSLLLVQITTKMLLFQVDPKPLAAIIAFSNAGELPAGSTIITGLHRAAKDVLGSSKKACQSIEALVADTFLPESSFGQLTKLGNQLDVSIETSPATLSQCLSLMKYSGKTNQGLNTVIYKMIIRMLQVRGAKSFRNQFSPSLSCVHSSNFLCAIVLIDGG